MTPSQSLPFKKECCWLCFLYFTLWCHACRVNCRSDKPKKVELGPSKSHNKWQRNELPVQIYSASSPAPLPEIHPRIFYKRSFPWFGTFLQRGFRIHLLSPTFLMLYFWSRTWTSLSTVLPLINKLVGWSAWFSFEILPQEPDTCWKMSLKRHDCQLTHVVLLASPAPRVHQEHGLEEVMCGVENTYMIYVAKFRASS